MGSPKKSSLVIVGTNDKPHSKACRQLYTKSFLLSVWPTSSSCEFLSPRSNKLPNCDISGTSRPFSVFSLLQDSDTFPKTGGARPFGRRFPERFLSEPCFGEAELLWFGVSPRDCAFFGVLCHQRREAKRAVRAKLSASSL